TTKRSGSGADALSWGLHPSFGSAIAEKPPGKGNVNMKKIAVLAVFVLALAAVRSDSSVGVVNNGSYSSVGVLNNGAQTVHFTAEYQNLIGGFFTCAGERIRRGPPNPFTKDS